MLVLTRKCQEVIVVGGANRFDPMLKITVLGIANGKVRLGIEAATDVPVHRLEVWERIRAGCSDRSDARDKNTDSLSSTPDGGALNDAITKCLASVE